MSKFNERRSDTSLAPTNAPLSMIKQEASHLEISTQRSTSITTPHESKISDTVVSPTPPHTSKSSSTDLPPYSEVDRDLFRPPPPLAPPAEDAAAGLFGVDLPLMEEVRRLCCCARGLASSLAFLAASILSFIRARCSCGRHATT